MSSPTPREAERSATDDRAEHFALVLGATNTCLDEWNILTGEHHMSPSWFAALGYADDTAEASDPSGLLHPDDRLDVDQRCRQHLDEHTDFYEHVSRYRHRNGTWTWHQVRSKLVESDDDGLPVRIISSYTDVTEQHQLEEQLTHSSTMQALASFSGGIAHDFNNIMAIVQGHTEALLHREFDAAERSRRLHIMLKSVDRANSLVKDLMRLTRPDESHAIVVDLSTSVAEIAASLPYLTGEDIDIVLVLTPEPTPIRIDPARLEAIILNLAANSCDAMPTGGRFVIRVATDNSPTNGTTLSLDVSDTGIGMSTETLNSAFRPFFSTKPPGAGTGLGLATTYDTVHHAGGTITALSRIGLGTTIHMRFPAARDSVEKPPQVTEHQAGTLGPSATVLLVEDDAEILELTADMLRESGYRVHEALDATEAIDILSCETIDLVITDAIMPGMSGADLAVTIANRWPTIPVLFLTGYAAKTLARASIDPRQVLNKPATEQELLHRAAEALRCPPPSSQLITG